MYSKKEEFVPLSFFRKRVYTKGNNLLPLVPSEMGSTPKTLRKHAYSNILKILQAKKKKIRLKKSDGKAVVTSTHNLWFLISFGKCIFRQQKYSYIDISSVSHL